MKKKKNSNEVQIVGSKENPVINLSQFMNVLNRLKEELRTTHKLDEKGDHYFLYRGMASDKFEIVGRINHDIKSLNRTVENKDIVEKVEKEIFYNFKQRARIYQKIEPKDDWEWIALARHHNVPTRILDWSRDPQVAIWFAVQDEKAFMHEHSVVYIYLPINLRIQHGSNIFDLEENKKYCNFENPFNIDKKKEIILYRPSSLNERIDYQSSWFTIHPFIGNVSGNVIGNS